jgi:hypothetical protein
MLQHAIPADFPRYRLTVEDFHKLGEIGILTDNARVELVEGELLEMAPIGSLHASVVNALNRMLVLAVGGSLYRLSAKSSGARWLLRALTGYRHRAPADASL